MLRALRRRGWVLLVAILVTTGCAYVVAAKHGETYTAESTAVVSASPHSLLTPDQANTLASYLRGPHTEGRRDPSQRGYQARHKRVRCPGQALGVQYHGNSAPGDRLPGYERGQFDGRGDGHSQCDRR